MIILNISEVILDLAKKRDTFSTNDVLKALDYRYGRAYVLRFIRSLLRAGKLVKSGSTRSALYAHVDKANFLGNSFEKRYQNKDLDDYKIWKEFVRALPFISQLSEHIRSILSYAFTEMVNNAIDHSKSSSLLIRAKKVGRTICFTVDDFGIGVFRNVMRERKLNSELEAIQDLLKGKTTTAPHAHSGEGIFFTSKVADIFTLDSYEYRLRIDNKANDIFVGEFHPKKSGTRVTFEIDEHHEGHLDDVFRRYYTDPEELAFDKTEIQIKLYTMGSVYISRSQAKRVLAGLEKFRSIILDFDRVPGVGQAFADEIFRVFQGNHSDIKITPINMNESVNFMIKRVEKPSGV